MSEQSTLPKFLIVDHLKENLNALGEILKDEEIDIVVAQNVPDALNLLLEHDFALAMIDTHMSEMNGFELAEVMRTTEKTKHIPIMFITARDVDTQRILRGYEVGAVDFLHRPLLPHVVLGKVRVFLKMHQQKMRLQYKLQKIKETENTLQEALQSRDTFLSICSHELKTPLTTLKMQIQITNRLRERKGDDIAFSNENMSKFLLQADKSVDRIIHLVNDMLDISRISTGKLSLNKEPVELMGLIHDVTDRLETLMNFSNCPVTIYSHPEIQGQWDKFRIEQVITNLLTNVAKYAPDAPVEIQAWEEEGHAYFSVKDHGKGISEDYQKFIFDRFARAVTSDSVTGLGLGLYISKEIIQLHQGDIEVESTKDAGTKFLVRLPLN